MAEAPNWLPVQTLHLQLQALETLGLDGQRVRTRLGPLPDAPDALVPVQTYRDMWDQAQALYGLPGLPSAMAMAIPFGAFGALDYLAGSADTIGGVCESVTLHFAMVANDLWLELDALEEGDHALRIRGPASLPVEAFEFTLAALCGRLRYVSDGGFKPRLVGLPTPRPARDDVREGLFGMPLTHGYPCAEIVVDAATWQAPTHSADPFLHATLKRMAPLLHIAQADDSLLERALRARLRAALPHKGADPARMAVLLGVSERTLQRRLTELGRSFSDVVEDFRREEAARLLSTPGVALVEIASRLGYAEQTSFTRAFRRWTGSTPGAWRLARQVTG